MSAGRIGFTAPRATTAATDSAPESREKRSERSVPEPHKATMWSSSYFRLRSSSF